MKAEAAGLGDRLNLGNEEKCGVNEEVKTASLGDRVEREIADRYSEPSGM